jgi:hypothetical protein
MEPQKRTRDSAGKTAAGIGAGGQSPGKFMRTPCWPVLGHASGAGFQLVQEVEQPQIGAPRRRWACVPWGSDLGPTPINQRRIGAMSAATAEMGSP